jgi:hypothetical protein
MPTSLQFIFPVFNFDFSICSPTIVLVAYIFEPLLFGCFFMVALLTPHGSQLFQVISNTGAKIAKLTDAHLAWFAKGG